MTVLAELGAYLDTQVASLTIATNLFLGQMPDAPDTAVCLRALPGGRPDFTLGATPGTAHAPNFEYHRVQAEIRAANAATAYTDAETLAWTVYNTLSLVGTTLSGVRYLLIEPRDIPAPLEEDSKGRVSFVVNFDIQREHG